MGFVKDFFNDVTGKTAAKAAQRAADTQSRAATEAGERQADAAIRAAQINKQATEDAIASQERITDRQITAAQDALETARADLQPFRQAGEEVLPGLTSLVQDPQAQLDFIQDNPFFDALANRTTQELANLSSAGGGTFSGRTAEALQNSLLLLGNNLVNQSITQRQNIASQGQSAAAGQAAATQQTAGLTTTALGTQGANIGNLIVQGGQAQSQGILGSAQALASGILGSANAQAAGLIGAGNARTQGAQNLFNTGAALAGLGASGGIKL